MSVPCWLEFARGAYTANSRPRFFRGIRGHERKGLEIVRISCFIGNSGVAVGTSRWAHVVSEGWHQSVGDGQRGSKKQQVRAL